jgi:hypothetical protein
VLCSPSHPPPLCSNCRWTLSMSQDGQQSLLTKFPFSFPSVSCSF